MSALPQAGRYPLKSRRQWSDIQGQHNFNVYVNGRLHRNAPSSAAPKRPEDWMEAMPAKSTGRGRKHDRLRRRASAGHLVRRHGGRVARPLSGQGLQSQNGDVTFRRRLRPDVARHLERPKKIYFFSWDGTAGPGSCPPSRKKSKTVTLHPLTQAGRGRGSRVKSRRPQGVAASFAAGAVRFGAVGA